MKYAPIGKRITPNDNIVEGLNRRGVTVLDKNSQAPTITSIPDELVHYCEPRILTVREHARIQSFPDWYEFKGKYTSGGARRKKEVPSPKVSVPRKAVLPDYPSGDDSSYAGD
mgnify:CR=1 FL=1